MGYPQDFNQSKAFLIVRTARWPLTNIEENENEHFEAHPTTKDISRSSTFTIYPANSDKKNSRKIMQMEFIFKANGTKSERQNVKKIWLLSFICHVYAGLLYEYHQYQRYRPCDNNNKQ